MDSRAMSHVAVGLLIGMAGGFLWLLFRGPAPVAVERRITDVAAERAAGTLPGATPVAPGLAAGSAESTGNPIVEPVRIEGERAVFDGKPGESVGSWPGFRGDDFSNGAEVTGGLLETWPESGPPALWRVRLGAGYAGPSVRAGRVFVLDYDESVGGDSLRCFSLADGREIWRRTYRAPIKKNHGFSRTVPAVTDAHVVTLGPRCVAMCVRPANGDFLWGTDLVATYGTEVPLWYTGQNPVIDGGVAILAPGGQALLVGLDCETGREVWRTPNPDGWKMSHSSVLVTTLLGRRMYVYCAKEGIVGVSAAAEDRGRVLWKTTAWAHAVTSPSPVPVGDRRLFLTAGYGGGSLMLEVSERAGAWGATPLYELEKTIFSSEQHTPLLYRDHLFAVLPKDAGENRAQLACLGLDGRLVWTSGKTERFGLGPFLRLGDRILVLADDGTLTLARASLTSYERLARARVLNGREAWAPMAWVDGRLLVRDFEEMVCLDLRAPTRTTAVAGKGS